MHDRTPDGKPARYLGAGWSIRVRQERMRAVLVGVGWFGLPFDRRAGHDTMVWNTRREARAALPRVQGAFRGATVVRVRITVEEEIPRKKDRCRVCRRPLPTTVAVNCGPGSWTFFGSHGYTCPDCQA